MISMCWVEFNTANVNAELKPTMAVTGNTIVEISSIYVYPYR